MNRRRFFGMTAAAIVAAGLPALVLPARKIFLPPAKGWPIRIREVEAYIINSDSLAFRWDAGWITPSGEYEQHYILEEPSTPDLMRNANLREFYREHARELLAAKVPMGARMVQLELPRTTNFAAYV